MPSGAIGSIDGTDSFETPQVANGGREKQRQRRKTTRAANVVVVLANNVSMLLGLLVVQGVLAPWFLAFNRIMTL